MVKKVLVLPNNESEVESVNAIICYQLKPRTGVVPMTDDCQSTQSDRTDFFNASETMSPTSSLLVKLS